MDLFELSFRARSRHFASSLPAGGPVCSGRAGVLSPPDERIEFSPLPWWPGGLIGNDPQHQDHQTHHDVVLLRRGDGIRSREKWGGDQPESQDGDESVIVAQGPHQGEYRQRDQHDSGADIEKQETQLVGLTEKQRARQEPHTKKQLRDPSPHERHSPG